MGWGFRRFTNEESTLGALYCNSQVEGDQELLMAAHKVRYDKGEVVEGTIGSADVWNNELDQFNFSMSVMVPQLKKWKRLLLRKSQASLMFRF